MTFIELFGKWKKFKKVINNLMHINYLENEKNKKVDKEYVEIYYLIKIKSL